MFFSGIIRRDIRLTAISLLVIFLYGSLVWGIFPFFPQLSWEYHFWGGVSGLIASILYRKEGPLVKVVEWGDEISDEEFAEIDREIESDEKSFSTLVLIKNAFLYICSHQPKRSIIN